MIDLTPLEVRKKKGDFRKALRGYDPALVDDFLDLVADRLDQLVRDNLAMTERLARLEHQVSDNRDRERALTDALVTAQEMREEMQKQTAREADLLRRTAQQESDQVRRLADHESTQMRRAAEQASAQIRTEAMQAREREEEVLRRLRARQQQLLQSYRTFLAREMAELQVIGETLEIEAMSPAYAAPAPAPVSQPAAVAAPAMVMGANALQSIPEEEPFAPEPVEEWGVVPKVTLEDDGVTLEDQLASEEDELARNDDTAEDEPRELQFDEHSPAAITSQLIGMSSINVGDDLEDDGDVLLLDSFDDVQDEDAVSLQRAIDDELAEEDPEVRSKVDAPAHDAAVLLENALRAGYRLKLDDEDDMDELLLDDAATPSEQAEPPADWLDEMIDR